MLNFIEYLEEENKNGKNKKEKRTVYLNGNSGEKEELYGKVVNGKLEVVAKDGKVKRYTMVGKNGSDDEESSENKSTEVQKNSKKNNKKQIEPKQFQQYMGLSPTIPNNYMAQWPNSMQISPMNLSNPPLNPNGNNQQDQTNSKNSEENTENKNLNYGEYKANFFNKIKEIGDNKAMSKTEKGKALANLINSNPHAQQALSKGYVKIGQKPQRGGFFCKWVEKINKKGQDEGEIKIFVREGDDRNRAKFMSDLAKYIGIKPKIKKDGSIAPFSKQESILMSDGQKIRLHMVKGVADEQGNLTEKVNGTTRNCAMFLDGAKESPVRKIALDGQVQEVYTHSSATNLLETSYENAKASGKFNDDELVVMRGAFEAITEGDIDSYGKYLSDDRFKGLRASATELLNGACVLKYVEELNSDNPDENKLKNLQEMSGVPEEILKNAKYIMWSKDTSQAGWDWIIYHKIGNETYIAESDEAIKKAKEKVLETKNNITKISTKTGSTSHTPDYLSKFTPWFSENYRDLPEEFKKELDDRYKNSTLWGMGKWAMNNENPSADGRKRGKHHQYLSWFLGKDFPGGESGVYLDQEEIDKMNDTIEEMNGSSNKNLPKELERKLSKVMESRLGYFIDDPKKLKDFKLMCKDGKDSKGVSNDWPMSITHTFYSLVKEKYEGETQKELSQEVALIEALFKHSNMSQLTTIFNKNGVRHEYLNLSGAIKTFFNMCDSRKNYKQSHCGMGVGAAMTDEQKSEDSKKRKESKDSRKKSKEEPKVESVSYDISFGRYFI